LGILSIKLQRRKGTISLNAPQPKRQYNTVILIKETGILYHSALKTHLETRYVAVIPLIAATVTLIDIIHIYFE
jgi:hypothetical protein